MRLRFNEKKATQVAALLLNLRGTGRMNYMKLIKLMYLVDRKAFQQWGRPVSTDRYVSMDKGPVLSHVYSLISEEPNTESVWSSHISTGPGYEVVLKSDPGLSELSRAEEQLIREVFSEHGHKNRWDLVRELHDVPEWQDPCGSMIPIDVLDILRAVGKSPADIEAIQQDMDAEAAADLIFQSS